MAEDIITQIATQLALPVWALVLAFVWSFVWKALALWKSARKTHYIWFALFFFVQSLGILEILYIFLFSEIKLSQKSKKPLRKKRRK